MPYFILKLLLSLIIFAIGLGCGFLAIRQQAKDTTKSALSLSEHFAGGVFLGAGMLHLLPDALTRFHALLPNQTVPWILLLCCATMLLLHFIEKMFVPNDHNGQSIMPLLVGSLLSIHAVFGGIALGIDPHLSDILIIFTAIIAHKGAAAFALGMSMVTAQYEKRLMIKVMLIFSLMTPLGIFVGESLHQLLTSHYANVSEALIDALTAGTFIYIAITQQHLKKGVKRSHQIMAYVLGLFYMGLLSIWI